MNITHKIIIVIIFLALVVGGAFYFDKGKKKETPNPYADSAIEVKTFANADNTWGYDITIDGNIYVHQPNKPAVGGDKGFATEADAEKTGELVVSKIKNNILPPSVTPEELKNLGVF